MIDNVFGHIEEICLCDDLTLRRYRLGERYVMGDAPSPHRIHLRVGFGCITIKAIPAEAFAPTDMKWLNGHHAVQKWITSRPVTIRIPPTITGVAGDWQVRVRVLWNLRCPQGNRERVR